MLSSNEDHWTNLYKMTSSKVPTSSKNLSRRKGQIHLFPPLLSLSDFSLSAYSKQCGASKVNG